MIFYVKIEQRCTDEIGTKETMLYDYDNTVRIIVNI